MRRLMVSILFLAVALAAAAPLALAQEAMKVHFVVVTSSDDVTEADFKGLKQIFLEHAGGYTEMPSTVGSSMHGDKSAPEEVNTSFLVAGKKNIAPQIREYLEGNKHFGSPFILVWDAERH